MTAYPIPENHGMWWLTTKATWDRLHAIPGDTLTPDELHDAIDWLKPILGVRAMCGLTTGFDYAGMISRFTMRRCATCCVRLGVPRGRGTPSNERAASKDEGGTDAH